MERVKRRKPTTEEMEKAVNAYEVADRGRLEEMREQVAAMQEPAVEGV